MTKKKILLILIPILITIIGVFSYLMFFHTEQPKDKTKIIVKKSGENPIYYSLEKITVNLTDVNRVFLQITILLEVNNNKEIEILKEYLPKVKNRLIRLLSSKTKEELLTKEGKLNLQKDIKKIIAEPFGDEENGPEIKDVLFTQFIIQ